MSEPRVFYGILASVQDGRSSALKRAHETRTFEGFRLVHGEDYDKLQAELDEVKRINLEDCISRGLHESRMKAADEREAFLKSQNERLIEALKRIVGVTETWSDERGIVHQTETGASILARNTLAEIAPEDGE